jgi:hypothetical protein
VNSCSSAGRSDAGSVLAGSAHTSLGGRVAKDTSSPVRRRRSCMNESFTSKPIATQAMGTGASTGTTTTWYTALCRLTIATALPSRSACAIRRWKANGCPSAPLSIVSAATRRSRPMSVM